MLNCHGSPDLPAELYLDLLKKCVTRYIFPEAAEPLNGGHPA